MGSTLLDINLLLIFPLYCIHGLYYFAVRSMVIQSLENIVREELNRHIARINLHKTALDLQQEQEAEDGSNIKAR
jgi:hypothetical protein